VRYECGAVVGSALDRCRGVRVSDRRDALECSVVDHDHYIQFGILS
jgi:hypothetical protein